MGELRSLVKPGIPVLALTATASKKTRQKVAKTLILRKPHYIVRSPNRDNIKLVVRKVKGGTLETSFSWLVEELKEKGVDTPRTLIYCKSVKDCADIYNMLLYKLGNGGHIDDGKKASSYNRLFAMFFHSTPEQKKQYISENLQLPEGHYRVIVCTNALGMGVDFRDITRVVNYGCPRDLEAYIQESGRAGRAGQNAVAALFFTPVHLLGCDEGIKKYVRNTNECRRQALYAEFGHNNNDIVHHSCCDICAGLCKCNGDSCSYQPLPIELGSTSDSVMHDEFQVRAVSENDRDILRDCLNELQLNLAKESACVELFSTELIDEIVEKAMYISSFDYLIEATAIAHPAHALEVVKVFEEVFDETMEVSEDIKMLCHSIAADMEDWEFDTSIYETMYTDSDTDSETESLPDIVNEFSVDFD